MPLVGSGFIRAHKSLEKSVRIRHKTAILSLNMLNAFLIRSKELLNKTR